MQLGNRNGGIPFDSAYLRAQAVQCVRLARECPHLPTSHQLEAIGQELMLKAAELDELLNHWSTESSGESVEH